jgi:lysozyme
MNNHRAFAYQDHLGFWTIGVGRLIDKRKGGGLTAAECDYLLANDVRRFEAELDAAAPWWKTLDPVRKRVLLDMAFNLGTNGLMQFKNTLAFVKAGKYSEAATGMLSSKWATQVGARAITLSEMMKTGKDPDWLK